MLIVRPDFARRIDLAGAGPCARPVDIDRSRTGFSTLVSLRVYSFLQSVVIDGDAEDNEVFIIAMRGQAEIVVTKAGQNGVTFSLASDGGSRAVYMPPSASYRLTAISDCDVAYARVEPVETQLPEPRSFAPVGDWLDVTGYATAMDLVLTKVVAGHAVGSGVRDAPTECFVHLRAAGPMSASITGKPLDDWDTVALDGGASPMRVEMGTVEILTISASNKRRAALASAADQPQ